MLKKFSLWLEEREKERRIRKELMSRLFPNADIDPATVKIGGLHMLPKAIDELGIEDENTVDKLKGWAMSNKGATLAQFLTQLSPDDIPDKQEMPGDPAQLPPEQAAPSPQQGQMPPPPPEGQPMPNNKKRPQQQQPPQDQGQGQPMPPGF